MRYLSKNIKLPILDIAILMMIISDNVATNILIDFLGIDNINKIKIYWESKTTKYVDGIFFSAHYKDIVAKSRRIGAFFK